MNALDIEKGMNALAAIDADIAQAVVSTGQPAPRIRENSLETLLSIIVSQQISTSAAQAIMTRVSALTPELTGEAILELPDESLREAGLSWRKVEYAKGLASAIIDGSIDIEQLEHQSDSEVIEAITGLRGFGRWSAEIYLMFSLRRQDIFPADDLALLVALGRLKRLEDRPTPAQARKLVEHWAPYRSIGSLFLWHYYKGAPA